MKKITLIDQERTGLLPEHGRISPPQYTLRATIPAVEALREAGATVEPLPDIGYRITLGKTMPGNIIAVHLNSSPGLGLRLEIEPPYPDEFPDFWAQLDFTPCPVCSAPIVWYEAGYVPGYRVCTRKPHHHSRAK